MGDARIHDAIDDGLKHLAFAVLICLLQHHRGRYFLIEHPASAKSWSTRVMQALLSLPRVKRVVFDFCMLGMVSEDEFGRGAARKRTAVAANSEMIAAELEMTQCDGSHRHVALLGGRPRACHEYTEEFCHLVCRAYARQIAMDTSHGGIGRVAVDEDCRAVDVSDIMRLLVEAECARESEPPERRSEVSQLCYAS